MSTLRRALVSVASLAFAACGAAPGVGEEDTGLPEVSGASSELTNSAATPGLAFVVRIGGCTGTVISPHYIITAAHCFERTDAFNVLVRNGQTSSQVLYSGLADVAIHPGWVDGASNRESWDIAAVHLRGAGLGTAIGKAKIYKGPETPWQTRNATLEIEGYGFGSGLGGVDDCAETNQVAGTKRRSSFLFSGQGRVESGVWQATFVSHPSRTTCQGDSGSPYFIRRNGFDFMVAVHSRSERVHGGTARGSILAPKLPWVQAFAHLVNQPLTCVLVRDHRFATYTEHYDCRE